ncbi:MAG TPA: SpoIIE family protein phosphatase [Acidobacteriaceae bacterium]|nr:SpoIIE family protein phosphatase [Acidobacteriaceae bacterium]
MLKRAGLLVLLVFAAGGLRAQSVDATSWHTGALELTSDWVTNSGDNPAWASPTFDDSSWHSVEIDDIGAAQPGYRWFRLRVQLSQNHPHIHLLIVGGDGVYELYINGQKAEGPELRSQFGTRRPVEWVIPVMTDANSLTLALRTHAPLSYTGWHDPLFLDFKLGTPDSIETAREAAESQRLYAELPSLFINLLLILAAFGVLALFRSQSTHREYLWLGLYLLLLGLSNLALFSAAEGLVALAANNFFGDPLIYFFTIMQIEFTFSFAGQRVGRVWRAYEGLLAAMLMINWLADSGVLAITRYVVIEAIVILPAALLLPILLLVWYRRGNREAGWLILPSLLPAAAASIYDIGSGSIFADWGKLDFLASPIPLGPIPLQISDLSDFLFLLAIAVVIFFRFTRVSREQARSAAELDAAREMQRHMVPASLPQVPGYAIEAAYLPAAEVGGDFYQILGQRDGSTLIVVGDVSGKGLKAAMTGTLALGALRTLAAEGLAPAALLVRLNEQIVSAQEDGFITCLCVQICPDGRARAANAGHLIPYRNGEEVAMDSALPLGLADKVDYAEASIALEPGDILTLLSDGVVEAMSASGELFGFERTRAISMQSAAQIAAAGQAFGQKDDITVLTLTLTGAGAVHG